MLLPQPKIIIDYWNLFLGIEPGSESKSEVNGRFLDSIKEYSKIFSLIKFLFCGFLSGLSSNKKIAYFEVRCRELQDCALSASSLNECLFAVREFRKIRTLEWKNACMGDALTMFSTGILRSSIKYFENFFPFSLKIHHNWQDQILGQLISNVSSLASAAPIEQISKIAKSIHSNRRARDLFLDDKFADSAVLTTIKNSKDLDFLNVSINFYLKNWGCRVSGELMLTEKTWLEAPVLFIGELRKRVFELFNYGSNETATNNGQPIEDSNKYMRSELFLLKNWRKFALKTIVKFCHYSIKLRERARLGQSMAYGSLRISALKIGNYFASQKLLMFADDILFLELDEIESVCTGSYLFSDTLIKMVEIRKHAYRIAPDGVSAGRKTIVPICKSMNIISEDVSDAQQSGKKFIFSGNGVAPGVAKGVAFVANSFGDAQNIPRNSILITRNTDPGWTPLFGRISGLVIENGGMLCHGAIIARELGIPCVTGIIGAVKNIASGAHVKLDGSKGIVEIFNPLP